MNLFNNMINENTKYNSINYMNLKKENVIDLNIIPENILKGGIRYLNWIVSDNKLYHFKMFDFNDFIGQKLCEYMNLDCVKYDLAKIKGSIQTYSLNFVDNNYSYYNIANIHHALNSKENLNNKLDYFIKLLYKNGFNKEKIECLVDDLLKMSVIDYFSRQTDRFYNNYMFKVKNEDISLAPLYDFGESFSFNDGEYRDYGFNYRYNNELIKISWALDLNTLKKYPQIKLYLEKMYYINLLELIEKVCEEYKLNLSQELIEIYKKEEKYSKMRIKELI